MLSGSAGWWGGGVVVVRGMAIYRATDQWTAELDRVGCCGEGWLGGHCLDGWL